MLVSTRTRFLADHGSVAAKGRTDEASRVGEAEMRSRRLLGAGVALAVMGIAISLAGCAIALPQHTVSADSYSSIANSKTNETIKLSFVVFVRRAAAVVRIPYQLYDGEEMISAGGDSDLCHVYRTSSGMHTLGLSFVSGMGTTGNIPNLRFRFIEAELAPGKVYYVSINIGDTFLGGFVGGLQPVSPRYNNDRDLSKWLATCHLVKFDAATAKKEWVERYSTDFKPMFNEAYREWQEQVGKVRLSPADGFDGFVAAAATP
jgi:hypothetical protein